MRIAVVGGGIAGMTAAYLLHPAHEVVLYEAGDYLGGHTNTVRVELGGAEYAVDTGFIVYNERTYPNFIKLLKRLGVATQPSDMSFSLSCARSGYEYAGTSLDSFFAQRRNLVNLKTYRLLLDILRFNRRARQCLHGNAMPEVDLATFCASVGVSEQFRTHYLVPMMAAIWSADPADVSNFPAAHFLRFFDNHGLLSVGGHPPWRVITGGSQSYVGPLSAPYRDKVRLSTPVRGIMRDADGVTVTDMQGHPDRFDQVVLALHSDQALKVLSDPSPLEREVLGAIRYQENEAVLHTDVGMLPRNRRAWASWNYRIPKEASNRATLSYNMNRLQGLDAPETLCVTLNQSDAIAPERILRRFVYAHPLLDRAALAAQKRQREIGGVGRTHFCGAYWGYGFHEDGVNSALAACAPFDTGGL